METSDNRQGVSGIENSTRGLKEALVAALKSFGSDGEPLIQQVEATQSRERLFLMWQVLREEYLKAITGSVVAPIQVKMPDGKIRIAKNCDEAIRIIQGIRPPER